MTPHAPPPTPSEVVTPEAADLLSTFRLAAMDGYNKQPVGSVETWVEEGKKRILLLYLAGKRDGEAAASLPALTANAKDWRWWSLQDGSKVGVALAKAHVLVGSNAGSHDVLRELCDAVQEATLLGVVAPSSAPPTQEPVAWAVLNADGKVPFVHLERLVAEGEAEALADKEGRPTVALALGFLSPERYVTNANK